MEALKQAMRLYADQNANADGLATTPIPGVRMMRAYGPTGPMRSIYKPLICLVLQGAKDVAVGNEVREFTAGQSLILSVDRLSRGAGGVYAAVLALKVLFSVLTYQFAFRWRRAGLPVRGLDGRILLIFGAGTVLLAAVLKGVSDSVVGG